MLPSTVPFRHIALAIAVSFPAVCAGRLFRIGELERGLQLAALTTAMVVLAAAIESHSRRDNKLVD